VTWRTEQSADVSGGLTDEKIWNELSLALIINRHCAEYIDDDVVSQELWRVWHATRLPWELDFPPEWE
jgi:hypothetical protein